MTTTEIGILAVFLMGVLAAGLFAWFKCIDFDVRWGGEALALWGVRIRFDHGAVSTPALGRELDQALKHIITELKDTFRDEPELQKFRVEVVTPGNVNTPTVPTGRLHDGSLAGGSLRTERALPITEKHWVAVITTDRTGAFLVHEVFAHMIPMRRHGSLNADHRSAFYGKLEAQVKRALAAETGVVLLDAWPS